MLKISRSWLPMRTKTWRPSMGGGREFSVTTPRPCVRAISPSPWKTAKLSWWSWRKKHETDFDGHCAGGTDDRTGRGGRLCEFFAHHGGECDAGKDLVSDRRLLRHQ